VSAQRAGYGVGEESKYPLVEEPTSARAGRYIEGCTDQTSPEFRKMLNEFRLFLFWFSHSVIAYPYSPVVIVTRNIPDGVSSEEGAEDDDELGDVAP
jgi:hypothetical protein